MRLFLVCEFTQLRRAPKLISLALVADNGPEFYVEVSDSYLQSDCNDFILQTVLPLLGGVAVSKAKAQVLMQDFFNRFDEPLLICTDSPHWHWDFFCDLACPAHRWPQQVNNVPINLTQILDSIPGLIAPDLLRRPRLVIMLSKVLEFCGSFFRKYDFESW